MAESRQFSFDPEHLEKQFAAERGEPRRAFHLLRTSGEVVRGLIRPGREGDTLLHGLSCDRRVDGRPDLFFPHG